MNNISLDKHYDHLLLSTENFDVLGAETGDVSIWLHGIVGRLTLTYHEQLIRNHPDEPFYVSLALLENLIMTLADVHGPDLFDMLKKHFAVPAPTF